MGKANGELYMDDGDTEAYEHVPSSRSVLPSATTCYSCFATYQHAVFAKFGRTLAKLVKLRLSRRWLMRAFLRTCTPSNNTLTDTDV